MALAVSPSALLLGKGGAGLALVVLLVLGFAGGEPCAQLDTKPLCFTNSTCIWDASTNCTEIAADCPSRTGRAQCNRGGACTYYTPDPSDAGAGGPACYERNSSIPNYARCEAHHDVESLQTADRYYAVPKQLALNCSSDPLCDWDLERGRCVPLRNVSCGEAAQTSRAECASRVGCYWVPTDGGTCLAFAWDGATACANLTSKTTCETAGELEMFGQCVWNAGASECRAPSGKPTRDPVGVNNSWVWLAYCRQNPLDPFETACGDLDTDSECRLHCSNATECERNFRPLVVAECDVTRNWTCSAFSAESSCDTLSSCYWLSGGAGECRFRDHRLGTDGYLDSWRPFVTDVWLDSSGGALELAVVMPQLTTGSNSVDQPAEPYQKPELHMHSWSSHSLLIPALTFDPSVVSSASVASSKPTNASTAYPTWPDLQTALRHGNASTLLADSGPYNLKGKAFVGLFEFEGRNTMQLRMRAADVNWCSPPSADGACAWRVELFWDAETVFRWNVSSVYYAAHGDWQVHTVRSLLAGSDAAFRYTVPLLNVTGATGKKQESWYGQREARATGRTSGTSQPNVRVQREVRCPKWQLVNDGRARYGWWKLETGREFVCASNASAELGRSMWMRELETASEVFVSQTFPGKNDHRPNVGVPWVRSLAVVDAAAPGSTKDSSSKKNALLLNYTVAPWKIDVRSSAERNWNSTTLPPRTKVRRLWLSPRHVDPTNGESVLMDFPIEIPLSSSTVVPSVVAFPSTTPIIDAFSSMTCSSGSKCKWPWMDPDKRVALYRYGFVMTFRGSGIRAQSQDVLADEPELSSVVVDDWTRWLVRDKPLLTEDEHEYLSEHSRPVTAATSSTVSIHVPALYVLARPWLRPGTFRTPLGLPTKVDHFAVGLDLETTVHVERPARWLHNASWDNTTSSAAGDVDSEQVTWMREHFIRFDSGPVQHFQRKTADASALRAASGMVTVQGARAANIGVWAVVVWMCVMIVVIGIVPLMHRVRKNAKARQKARRAQKTPAPPKPGTGAKVLRPPAAAAAAAAPRRRNAPVPVPPPKPLSGTYSHVFNSARMRRGQHEGKSMNVATAVYSPGSARQSTWVGTNER